MKTYKDWICRYYSEHEDGEPDGVIIQELVRCKDCKFNPKKIVLGCPMAGSMSRNDDSFCSVGKRRKTKDTTEEVRKQLKDMEQRREMDRKK